MARLSSPLENPLSIVTTPATIYTREVGIMVRVSSDATKLKKLPIKGDTYKDAAVCKVRMSEFKNYVCTAIEGKGEYIYVYFGAPKTAKEAMTPFKDPQEKLGNLFWHPTLLEVQIVRMKTPRAVNLGDKIVRGYSYQPIPVYHASMDTGTLFTLRQYLTPDEPRIAQTPTQQVAPVNFPVPGTERGFSFPECYHPDIPINVMKEVVDVYDTVGASVTSTVGSQGPFHFPATDPPYPTPYILYNTPQKLATGLWLRDEMEVTPPPLPPITVGSA